MITRTRVYFGNDVGVRVYRDVGKEGVIGRVVVRINDRWQEVDMKPVDQQ